MTLVPTFISYFSSELTSQVQTAGPGPLCGPWFKFQFYFQSLGSAALVCPTVRFPEVSLEPGWIEDFQNSIN